MPTPPRSCCRSARQRVGERCRTSSVSHRCSGQGSPAFLCAGAASVLASLWQLGDASTSDLMLDLYGGMLGGSGKPAALRDAKERLIRRQPEYAKPYYWA